METQTLKPKIIEGETCQWFHYYNPDKDTVEASDFTFYYVDDENSFENKVVVLEGNRWQIEKAKITKGYHSTEGHFYRIYCAHGRGASLLAFPIDPRMTEEFINGATIHKTNASNDGWLFYHDHPGSHHNHLLSVRAAVVALFQEYVDSALHKVASATNDHTRRTVNSKYAALIAFRHTVQQTAQATEKAHTLGHYAQNLDAAEGHVHKAVRLAVSAAKVEWAKTPAQLAKYRLIATEVGEIITALATPHAPETPWDKAARIAAEEAAKKKAAAQTPSK